MSSAAGPGILCVSLSRARGQHLRETRVEARQFKFACQTRIIGRMRQARSLKEDATPRAKGDAGSCGAASSRSKILARTSTGIVDRMTHLDPAHRLGRERMTMECVVT